ncbi:MAG TPA: hypothetical protein ENN69_06785, partial [Spirochaetia bacterium]|nr:hypothetical protein [Spirochaetia bacterium]
IVFLKSDTKEEAFKELVDLLCTIQPALASRAVLDEIRRREELATTKLVPGIAIPHAKLPELTEPVIVLGRSERGIRYDLGEDDRVYLLVMIVSDEERYLPILSGLAGRLNDERLYRRILDARTAKEIHELFVAPRSERRWSDLQLEISLRIVRHARELYHETEADALVIYADAVNEIGPIMEVVREERVYLVTQDPEKYRAEIGEGRLEPIGVPYGGLSRAGQIELTTLFLAARGVMKKGSVMISVYGRKGSGVLDTVMAADCETELAGAFAMDAQVLPEDLKQEVFARAVQVITELAVEGREGKPVGTIFIVGDQKKVTPFCRQLVVNPFQGLPETERNILDPSLEETIKEFSKLDGAFVIRGDGLVVTAGAYLSTPLDRLDIQPGLGARHAAAAALTGATDALALVLSESTRKVSLFRAGKRVLVF